MAHYKGAATEATRAMHIMRKRERAREELELKKRKVEEDVKLSTIDDKFATYHDSIESQLKSSTVGLVTLEQMRKKQESAVKERQKQLAHKEETLGNVIRKEDTTAAGTSREPNKRLKVLSYYDDDDSDSSTSGKSDKKISTGEDATRKEEEKESSVEQDDHKETKPVQQQKEGTIDRHRLPEIDVDTSFLPNREREEEERLLREKLAAEWRDRQQKLKEEEIEITFSYWDGSGHRKVVRMKKGNSIYQFLQACLECLRKDFNELRTISADQLMYVKEDLIIPHYYTFYDFIVTKARGKSGPLFSFDVHDDIRLIADARLEKDESHAGKVLLRSWYERNKHIFPASRWEPYDPTRSYEKYTISDKKNNK